MKFPKEAAENGSETKKVGQRMSAALDPKTSEEVGEDLCDVRFEDGDRSNCAAEANATALVPPWMRSSLGLMAEKGARSNHKCPRTLPASGERDFAEDTCDAKADLDENSPKGSHPIRESSSSNPIIEVNIGNEADFPEESDSGGKIPPMWRSRGARHGQYESNTISASSEKRLPKSVKSEVTSIDVVVPAEEQPVPEEERKKVRSHKTRTKTYKRGCTGCPKPEEAFRADQDGPCTREPEEATARNEGDHDGWKKQSDARLLLLCGKNTIDILTEEDVSLLQEMRNQIGHKEGIEKVFNEIKERAAFEKITGKETKPWRGEKREESDKFKREADRASRAEFDNGKVAHGKDGRTGESETRTFGPVQVRGKAAAEESEAAGPEGRRHHERKKLYQQRKDTSAEKVRSLSQKTRDACIEDGCRERKSRFRRGDLSVMEKAVSETLHKFIDLYRFQIPPDIVSTMKRNIIQSLQSECPQPEQPRRSTEEESGRGGEGRGLGAATGAAAPPVPLPVPVFHVRESRETAPVAGGEAPRETRPGRECDVGEDRDVKSLRGEFDKCLASIHAQLDIAGTKLCSVVLEKVENETEAVDRKVKIVHNLSSGVTESIRILNETGNLGSPEGDNSNTNAKFFDCHFCDCRRTFGEDPPAKRTQGTQTKERKVVRVGTQTEWLDLPVRQLKNADLAPGLYRIIKATELGRFYLCPEALDEDEDADEKGPTKGSGGEVVEEPEASVGGGEKGDKSFSRETFVSEKGAAPFDGRRLRRMIKSDCIGLNSLRCEDLARKESKRSLLDLLARNLLGERGREEEAAAAAASAPVAEAEADSTAPGREEPTANVVDSESYHVGCVWFWNGKKMDPGVDLKDHVEDLLRERLRELMSEVKLQESQGGAGEKAEGPEPSRSLETEKAQAKFCIEPRRSFGCDVTPFIFSGAKSEVSVVSEPLMAGDSDGTPKPEEENRERSVREVGTQNSQHMFVSLNITKLKPRSKLCTVAKFSKQRYRKQPFGKRNPNGAVKPFAFAENVGEAKKVKLEFRESSEPPSGSDRGSNAESVRQCFSIVSNGSSTSTDGPVHVKLIGIEVSKEKSPAEADSFESCCRLPDTKKFVADDFTGRDKPTAFSREQQHQQQKKYKHWELIENVLNRVSQKEKDSLWNDIRDFVKKKIGRDINDEGAREVCIEIEQDVPKFGKGKSSHAVVARGNYSRNEGDVEVEVDLTLDDLERILRHRQRKLRRRQHYRDHKRRSEAKKSSSSTASSEVTSNGCREFGGTAYAGDPSAGFLTAAEMKMLKQWN